MRRHLIGLVAVVLLSSCARCEREAVEVPDAALAVDAAPAGTLEAPAADAAAALAPPAPATPEVNLYQEVQDSIEKGTYRPGMAFELAKIPPPTEAEMNDPRYQHLNEATRRSLIIFQKMQQKAPELVQPGDGKSSNSDLKERPEPKTPGPQKRKKRPRG